MSQFFHPSFFYPKGDTAYQSPWLAKGTRFRAPYKVGEEARNALNLPPRNAGTAVRKMKINPNEPIAGPRVPKPQPWRKQSGEGLEYFRGSDFPD